MDALLQQLLRELTGVDPAAAARLREILGSNLTPIALLRALYALIMEGAIDRHLLMRLLHIYARAGVLDAEMIAIAVAEAEADLAAQAAPAVARTPWWKIAVRGGVITILIYLLGAAFMDSQVELTDEPAGNGSCAESAVPVSIEADESSYGPKSALEDAKAEIKKKCAVATVNCTDDECKTCDKDAFVTFSDIKSRLFWYTAVMKADCRCWCK
ncbi:MAG: hypothetical protein ABJF11_16215 [Reichenbachiella sp.]|uniref:hypothetical protein n=1 Tax=Reichenbachiella sp. TaxID=2184521 RepID=UPI00326300C2